MFNRSFHKTSVFRFMVIINSDDLVLPWNYGNEAVNYVSLLFHRKEVKIHRHKICLNQCLRQSVVTPGFTLYLNHSVFLGEYLAFTNSFKNSQALNICMFFTLSDLVAYSGEAKGIIIHTLFSEVFRSRLAIDTCLGIHLRCFVIEQSE